MLDDVNMLLLAEQKKLKYLAFSIQPKNKHHLSLLFQLSLLVGCFFGKTKYLVSGFVRFSFMIPILWRRPVRIALVAPILWERPIGTLFIKANHPLSSQHSHYLLSLILCSTSKVFLHSLLHTLAFAIAVTSSLHSPLQQPHLLYILLNCRTTFFTMVVALPALIWRIC